MPGHGKGRQTQVNPGLGKLHSYIAYRRRMALNIGQSREIIFGEVVMAHVRDELIDPKTLYIDQLGLDAIRRW